MDVQRAMEFEKHIVEIIRVDLDRAQAGILQRVCRSTAGRSSRTTSSRTSSTTPSSRVPHAAGDISLTRTARTADVDQMLLETITHEEELALWISKAARPQVSPFVYSVITMSGWRDLPLLWR